MSRLHPVSMWSAASALASTVVVAMRVARDRGGCRARWLIALGVLLVGGRESVAGPYRMIVNGQQSDNAVKFDLATGAAELFALYEPGDEPRRMAMNSRGEIFSTLNEGSRNVVKLVPQPGSDVLVSQNFTPNIGFFGPGQIHFYQGDLYVAGNRSRVIFQYDGQTGEEIRTFSGSTSFNMVAMTIGGDSLYYSEIFQDRVWKFDLTETPPTGSLFFSDPERLSQSSNMTIGHDGNLVISNHTDPFIHRYDSETGQHLGTLANVTEIDPTRTSTYSIRYHAGLNNYFATSGDKIYRLDVQGNLLQMYQSPMLQQAAAVLIAVPEPSSMVLVFVAAIGLIARCSWRGRGNGVGRRAAIAEMRKAGVEKPTV